MKRYATVSLLFAALGFAALGMAQQPSTPAPTPFVKGSMTISFDTVSNADSKGNAVAGFSDKYAFDLKVSNSINYHGTIVRLPYVAKTFGSDQQGDLTFDIDCDVVNPRNPAQTKNIGKINGDIGTDKSNIYHFTEGSLGINTFSMGTAAGVSSQFKGIVVGKPPANESALAKLKHQVVSITRSIHGQTLTIKVANYDKLDFQSFVLAGGPVQTYPETTVNGSMLYDYDRNCWHFVNVSCTYWYGGKQYNDTISGDIRWAPASDRATSGKGEYDFDVRVNEPPPNEQAVFSAPTSESDFFATDTSITGLTGTMAYHDTFAAPYTTDYDTPVSASSVAIDLTGNNLTKQQMMYLTKLLLFTAVVPMNSN